MKLIVGLGNPGPKYELTRHNAGFIAIDLLAQEFAIDLSQSKFQGQQGLGSLWGLRVLLFKPETYMNLSGRAVARVMAFYKITCENIVVCHDDIDLPSQSVRTKMTGGHGGHNGVRSIIEETGSDQFPRIKLGVGRPAPEAKRGVSSWVLEPFTDHELRDLESLMYPAFIQRLKGLLVSS